MTTSKEFELLTKGFPIRLPFRKNTEKAPNMGSQFAQDIEPAGDYINYHDHEKFGTHFPNHIYGYITFQNPLIIEWESTGHGGWKTKLSERYNNLKGKKLTKAILKDGHDAIITIDSEYQCFSEIVNINGIKIIL